MDKTKLAIVWGFLVVLLVFGVVLGMQVGSLELKPVSVGDITQLLATFFVLALFVERTLEVFITAWRGKETVIREKELHIAKRALAESVNEAARQETVGTRTRELVEYKGETQKIALRTGLVLGILIAAVGVRTFGTFVVPPAASTATAPWSHVQAVTFAALDVLISGGIIGGGSDAIHKMMNVITGFFDATAEKLKTP
jgi:hypothetical protein